MLISELRQENGARGWTAIPAECPAYFVNRICEKRQRAITTGTPIPTPEFRGLVTGRPRSFFMASTPQVSLESIYRMKTGREYQSPQQLATRLFIVGQQVAREARVLAATEAAEARVADIVRAELFPWERN